MSRKLFIGTLLAILAIGAAWAVYASGPNGEQNCPGHENGKGHGMHGMHAVLQGATVKVTNISNGVTITITSDKPEQIKAIQERFANFGKWNGQHAEGSEACQKAHESGQCQGHEPGSAGHSEEKPTP